MPKASPQKRKTYTYGGLKKAKDDKDGWNKVSESSTSGSKIPKAKGIWSNVASVSPFKKSPIKEPNLSIKTSKKYDLFNFDDSDDCFTFKENGVKISPKKGQRTPSKLLNSPRSPTTVNPRLKGRSLPEDTVTISVGDLKSKKGKGVAKKTANKILKKGTLAALKAELTSPNKKSPKKLPIKGSLAELKAKIKSPVKKTKESPKKSPKKGSLAALKAEMDSPKKKDVPKTKPKSGPKKPSPNKTTKKSPAKKAPAKVVSKKVKSPKKSPQKESTKSNLRTTKTSQKRKVDSPAQQPSTKRKITNKTEKQPSPKKGTSKVSPVKQKPKLKTRALRNAKKDSNTRKNTTKSVSAQNEQVTSPVKRKVGRPRKNQNNSHEEPPAKRKAVGKNDKHLSASDDIKDDEGNDSINMEEDTPLNSEENSTEVTIDGINESSHSDGEIESNESAKDSEDTKEPVDEDLQSTEESQENPDEDHNDKVEKEEDLEEDDDNEEEEEEEEEEPVKAKSVFSYYDKQKKNVESIFGDSKKNVVIFDDDCDDDAKQGSQKLVVEQPEKKLNTPVKTAPSEEVDHGNFQGDDEEKKPIKVFL